MMRALYLDGAVPIHTMLDISALRVQREDESPRFFPLRRLSRVIVSGAVSFDTEALLALADYGIPVSFLDRKGTVRARLVGEIRLEGGLAQTWVDFLERPDSSQEYENWRRSHERRAAVSTLRRLGLNPFHGDTLGRLRDSATALAIRLADPPTVTECLRHLRSMTTTRIELELMQRGLGRSIRPQVDGEPDLSRDLTRILLWELIPSLVGWLRRRSEWEKRTGKISERPTRRQLTKLFEHNQAAMAHELSRLFAGLHRWLNDLF